MGFCANSTVGGWCVRRHCASRIEQPAGVVAWVEVQAPADGVVSAGGLAGDHIVWCGKLRRSCQVLPGHCAICEGITGCEENKTLLSYQHCIPVHRSVDELTTFYIFRCVNNVFDILLKIWHIIVWFGPNCLGKSTPTFRIYDMITNMPKCLSHHGFTIVKLYVVNRIIWTWPPVVVMLTFCVKCMQVPM